MVNHRNRFSRVSFLIPIIALGITAPGYAGPSPDGLLVGSNAAATQSVVITDGSTYIGVVGAKYVPLSSQTIVGGINGGSYSAFVNGGTSPSVGASLIVPAFSGREGA